MEISVIIPAYNEEDTIGAVILDFHTNLPEAQIVVIDNNSRDRTREVAKKVISEHNITASILTEPIAGKGNALRQAFLNIDADIYVLVDADTTYFASDAPKMIEIMRKERVDIVVGDRHKLGYYKVENKRRFHSFGNTLVKYLINRLYKTDLNDILSGYRVLNKTFVKTYPILCEGFEVETEMTLHALDKRFGILETPVQYRDRPKGSISKLNTLKDGFRIILTIFQIVRYYKPLFFFGLLSFFILVTGLVVGAPVIYEYIMFQYVYKVPSAVLAAGIVLVAVVLFAIGLILDADSRQSRFEFELKLLSRK